MIAGLRALSDLISRSSLASRAGLTFNQDRDLYHALGYDRDLTVEKYRQRYRRNPVAARVVEAYPRGTWRGIGGELFEDPDPKVITPFEEAWVEIAQRLKIWPTFMRADILAGLGRYGVLLIGGPGTNLAAPLPEVVKPEEVTFLAPFAEDHAKIKEYETSASSERYTQPKFYTLTNIVPENKGTPGAGQDVHWSRVIHLAEGALDDSVFGPPRLERVWNPLDDLEKLVGAGSEAFWLRAHQGYQFDLDKETELAPAEETKLSDEVDEFIHGLRRAVRTRGMKLQALGSDVANFDRNVESVISLISSGTGIPQRILMGSERGQLASEQDRVNWSERIQDRRNEYAGPMVVRPLVDRFIKHGILPTPEKGYEIFWPQIFDLSDDERAKIGSKYAEINQKNGTTVITEDEIRDQVLGLGPLPNEVKQQNDELRKNKATPKMPGRPNDEDRGREQE